MFIGGYALQSGKAFFVINGPVITIEFTFLFIFPIVQSTAWYCGGYFFGQKMKIKCDMYKRVIAAFGNTVWGWVFGVAGLKSDQNNILFLRLSEKTNVSIAEIILPLR